MVGVAVPVRTQAEAIAWTHPKAATALAVLLLALAGCGDGERGGGDSTTSTNAEQVTTEEEHSSGLVDLDDVAGDARPTPRDRDVQREIKRFLREEALGGAGGWRFADVKEVQARATQLAIDTRLRPARREAAASLCLAARRFFLRNGQGQTPYNVIVGGRGGILAKC